jgi:hypothetical protein
MHDHGLVPSPHRNWNGINHRGFIDAQSDPSLAHVDPEDFVDFA